MTLKPKRLVRPPSDLALRALSAVLAHGGARGRLSILIYHRVLATTDALHDWDPTAAQFDRQMRMLSGCFTPLLLADAVELMVAGRLPAGAVAVTFDDGYADNVGAALPVLRRHEVPATFFIATGYLDGGCMWNDRVVEALRCCASGELDLRSWGMGVLPLREIHQRRGAIATLLASLKHLPSSEREAKAAEIEARAGASPPRDLMMRESDVLELRRAGMGIGAHTVTHPILTRLTQTDARREIVASRDRLSAIVREPVTLFAYPNGKPGQDYAAEHVRIVKEAGFRAAVSTARGAASRRADLHQLPRFTPWQRDPLKFGLSLLANRRNSQPSVV